ncbi:MAG: hypothetical protein Q8L98_07905 [Chlamydiales bacterium]|nr:hypothetical protein [Chlamydiales bacterium]
MPDDYCRSVLAPTAMVPGTLPDGSNQAAPRSSSSSLSPQRCGRKLSLAEQSMEACGLSDLARFRASGLNWPNGLDDELRHVGSQECHLQKFG